MICERHHRVNILPSSSQKNMIWCIKFGHMECHWAIFPTCISNLVLPMVQVFLLENPTMLMLFGTHFSRGILSYWKVFYGMKFTNAPLSIKILFTSNPLITAVTYKGLLCMYLTSRSASMKQILLEPSVRALGWNHQLVYNLLASLLP